MLQEVKGLVKQKLVDKTSEEYTTYVPKENQLVIVKDGDNHYLVKGDEDHHTVNMCLGISGVGSFVPLITGQTFIPTNPETYPQDITHWEIGTMAITEYYSDDDSEYKRSLVVYMGEGQEDTGSQIRILSTITIDEPTQQQE